MTDSYFNTIVILDAIPEGELNTARRLKEDLEDISDYVAQNLIVRYYRLNNFREKIFKRSRIIHAIRENIINNKF